MEFGMPTAQPIILHGIHHTNPQKVLFFLIVKGNVDKTFQFATGVTSTDWFVRKQGEVLLTAFVRGDMWQCEHTQAAAERPTII